MSEVVLTEDGDIVVSPSEMAKIIGGVSARTVWNYAEKGMPFVTKGKHKAYKVKECLKWCYENGVLELNFNTQKEDEEDITLCMTPTQRRDHYTAELKKVELGEAKDELIEKAEVIKDASSVGIFLRDSLMSISKRISNILAGETSPKEIIKIIDKEIRQSLEDISSAFME